MFLEAIKLFSALPLSLLPPPLLSLPPPPPPHLSLSCVSFLFQMVQCGKCDHWIHATCENISDETYEILSELPEDSVVFNCRLCAPQPPGAVPPWRQAITDYTLQSFAKVSKILHSIL